METNRLEIIEVEPCKDGFEMGFLIGQRFSTMIRSRLQNDLILQKQMLPFAQSPLSTQLLTSLTQTNMNKYPNYWDELRGTAEGSGASFLEIMLVNLRKEMLPFIPNADNTNDDCSDILVVSECVAVAVHNEDANVALVGHTYLIKAALSNGASFTAYTYAGELPSCAFGFNSHGLAFTLNSVPPTRHEIAEGGIVKVLPRRKLVLGSVLR